MIAAIIDKGIPAGDAGYILKMGAILALLSLVGLASSVTAQYYAAKAAVGLAAKLRHALFEHIQKLSYSDLDSIGASTLITRMTSDVNQLQTGVNLGLRLFLRSPFIVFGSMLMAFTIDVKSALVFAVAIPVLAIIVFGIMLGSMPMASSIMCWASPGKTSPASACCAPSGGRRMKSPSSIPATPPSPPCRPAPPA